MLSRLLGGQISPLYFTFFLVSIIISLTIHEIAHGYVAYLMGDSTAKHSGRLSLNPIHHIDPFGFLALVFFGFGWAKPVMMNPYNFKHYRDGILLTALAGPFSNFLMAIAGSYLMKIPFPEIIQEFLLVFVYLNIILASFNILPIPPLDGYKVFSRVLPDSLYYKAEYIERRYGFYILLGMLITNFLYYIWSPVFNLLTRVVEMLTFS